MTSPGLSTTHPYQRWVGDSDIDPQDLAVGPGWSRNLPPVI
jgi:hypothetical protein